MSDATQPTDSFPPREVSQEKGPLHGLLAEYTSPSDILAASRKIRDAGFSLGHVHAFPVPASTSDGHQMTILPWLVLGAGLIGPPARSSAVVDQFLRLPVDHLGESRCGASRRRADHVRDDRALRGLHDFDRMLVLNNLPLPSHPLDFVRRFARARPTTASSCWFEAADPNSTRKPRRRFSTARIPSPSKACSRIARRRRACPPGWSMPS